MNASPEQADHAGHNCHRLVIRATLMAKHPFHVGSGEAGRFTDALIQRRPDGQPYLPASSVAGLLRSAAESLAEPLCGQAACDDQSCGQCPACRLFGYAPRGASEYGGHASRVDVDDAWLLTPLPDYSIEIRQHVGMSRVRGAAQAQLKYDHEVAPGGLEFRLTCTVERPSAQDLRLLLAVLDTWRVVGLAVGGRTSSGLGECELGALEFFVLDFSDDQILGDYLLAPVSAADAYGEVPPDTARRTRQEVLAQFGPPPLVSRVHETDAWLPQHVVVELLVAGVEPLLVMGSARGAAASEKESDAEFVRTEILLQGQRVAELVLPGSSLKGVLRTRAEKIVRTLNYAAVGAEQYAEHICACAVTQAQNGAGRLNACFGTPERQATADALHRSSREMAGVVYEHSCITCRLFGNSMMRGRLDVGEGQWLDPARTPHEMLFDHVAINRFSGGASDERKFDTRPLMPDAAGEAWFRVRLHLERPEPWMLGLLTELLKDLRDADVRLGHATRRGYGKVRAWVTASEALVLDGSALAGLCAEHLPDARVAEAPGPYLSYTLPLQAAFGAERPGEAAPLAGQAFIDECYAHFARLVEVLGQPAKQLGYIPKQEA